MTLYRTARVVGHLLSGMVCRQRSRRFYEFAYTFRALFIRQHLQLYHPSGVFERTLTVTVAQRAHAYLTDEIVVCVPVHA